MTGLNMGPMIASIGSCEHLRVVLPHTWELSLGESKFGLEVYWNVEDPMYKSDNVDNYRLVQIVQTPIFYLANLNTEQQQTEMVFESIKLHPLLRVSELRVSEISLILQTVLFKTDKQNFYFPVRV